MKRLVLVALLALVALPVMAKDEEPQPPPKSSWFKGRWFFGGGFGLSFGTIDSVTVAPLIGLRVAPRVTVGTQLYYQWIDDGRYKPSVTTNDYGATLFVRTRVIAQLFLEGDLQYTNYEYFNGVGTTDRATYTSFLAGAGYGFPMGKSASFYVSALYDFGYGGHSGYLPYDGPWRVQVGAVVGF